MPIYEYECICCSSRLEKKRSFSDNTTVCCPHCGGETKRIFSAVPIIFKGSGFYITDSRNSNSHALNDSSADKAKDSSTDVAKTNSTNDAKASNTGEAKANSNNEAKAGNTEKDS